MSTTLLNSLISQSHFLQKHTYIILFSLSASSPSGFISWLAHLIQLVKSKESEFSSSKDKIFVHFLSSFHTLFLQLTVLTSVKLIQIQYVDRIFHLTLSWYKLILSIKEKNTLGINRIKQLSNLVPPKVLYTFMFLVFSQSQTMEMWFSPTAQFRIACSLHKHTQWLLK